jgi:hypothetical protein
VPGQPGHISGQPIPGQPPVPGQLPSGAQPKSTPENPGM